jgi:hypothetical protein
MHTRRCFNPPSFGIEWGLSKVTTPDPCSRADTSLYGAKASGRGRVGEVVKVGEVMKASEVIEAGIA